MNLTREFPFKNWNWPAIFPDHFPQIKTVDEFTVKGSIGVSKSTTMSVERVVVMDCGAGEMEVIAGEPRPTAIAQKLGKNMEASLIGFIIPSLCVSMNWL